MRPASLPSSPARVLTAHRNSQGRTGRDNSSDPDCASAARAGLWAPREGPAAASPGISTETRAAAKWFLTRRKEVVFIGRVFAFDAGRMFFGRLAGRPEGRRYVDGFAYVKIEARILARAQCGKVSRFVLFASDIPSITEPLWTGAHAGKYSFAGSAGMGEARPFFRTAIRKSRWRTKNLAASLQRAGR